jgi:Protein of unknown function (DUF3048) N-terminal domain/Protein of unknown function (DUF3048) C-terminal domain
LSRRTQILAGIGGLLVVAIGAFILLGKSPADVPGVGALFDPEVCQLSGLEPKNDPLLDRPALAVKIENNPLAYPLSGLEDAEVVYEELVEGGITRFMAIYHCTDSSKAGPVRSSRVVDAAIMTPTTRILAAAGGNALVRKALDEAGIFIIDEPSAGNAMRRVPREGVASEHTLYGDTAALRKVGAKRFDDPPPDDVFQFGDLPSGGARASRITATFSVSNTIQYRWSGKAWLRSQNDEPFVAESGDQIAVDNVVIEEHEVNDSKIKDIAGNPSTEIADVTGTGRAVLFRNGRAFEGRWTRDSVEDRVVYETKGGDEMVFQPGTIWVELVPSDKGDRKGSFSFAK